MAAGQNVPVLRIKKNEDEQYLFRLRCVHAISFNMSLHRITVFTSRAKDNRMLIPFAEEDHEALRECAKTVSERLFESGTWCPLKKLAGDVTIWINASLVETVVLHITEEHRLALAFDSTPLWFQHDESACSADALREAHRELTRIVQRHARNAPMYDAAVCALLLQKKSEAVICDEDEPMPEAAPDEEKTEERRETEAAPEESAGEVYVPKPFSTRPKRTRRRRWVIDDE